MPLTKSFPAEILSEATNFVSTILNSYYVEITEFGARDKHSGRHVTWAAMLNRLIIERGRPRPKGEPKPPSKDVLDAAVSEWRTYLREFKETHTLNEVSYVGPTDDLALFLEAMTGHVDAKDLAVVQHWIWQIKQKFHERPVVYHMMPVFVGQTGSGKTIALNKLLDPVRPVVESGSDFSIFSDPRQWYLFGEKYIFFFDEMSKANRVDVESLKNIISTDSKTFRKLGTHQQVTVPQLGTFLGASNESLPAIISDPTSARRQWEIKTLNRCNWGLLETINYKAIWQSVDECAPTPLMAIRGEIEAVQENYLRHKSSVELWLEEECTQCEGFITRGSDLHATFKEWEDEADQRAKTGRQAFYNRLRTIPWVQSIHRVDGTYYNISMKRKTNLKILKGQGT